MLPIKTILLPTDFSKSSEAALRFACALARDYQARLLLLHVVEPPVYYGELGMAVPLPADFDESLRRRLEQLVPPESGVAADTMLVEGNAAREILRVAEEQHCDLIVMGTHGRSGLSRVVLGSVAEDVVRHSRVPVLTLKTPILLEVADVKPAAPGEETEGPAAERSADSPESRSVLIL
jgi:nucleotide-binding universal stress UspA family protein